MHPPALRNLFGKSPREVEVLEKYFKASVWGSLRKRFQREGWVCNWLMHLSESLWYHCSKKKEATDHSAFLFLTNSNILRVFSSSTVRTTHLDILCHKEETASFSSKDISVWFPHNGVPLHNTWRSQTPREPLRLTSCPHSSPKVRGGSEQAAQQQASPPLSGNRGLEEQFIWSRESVPILIWQLVLPKG